MNAIQTAARGLWTVDCPWSPLWLPYQGYAIVCQPLPAFPRNKLSNFARQKTLNSLANPQKMPKKHAKKTATFVQKSNQKINATPALWTAGCGLWTVDPGLWTLDAADYFFASPHLCANF